MGKKMRTMDGNTAAAHVAYAFTDVAAIYPITPSSNMAEVVDEWSAHGRKNIFGQTVRLSELQSEAGAAGAMHGALATGSLATTFTASQGLLLMIPNMYKMAGELLPGVMHVSARALASHALSIFGDHSDVMATRQTGFAMLASGSVQEVMDLAGIAHLSAIKSRIPFLHFFDGFRTSHEYQKIEVLDYDELTSLVDFKAIDRFRKNSLSPESPVTRGTAQNPDIFFQAREASNSFYNAVPEIVKEYMDEISKITGREYKPFNYYGAPDAKHIIVAMGSVTQTIEETIDYLLAKGEKVGLIKVHLYRPFSEKYFLDVLPKTVEKIAVLDRTKEPGALGEPLYQDIKTILYGGENAPLIVGGRYGLGSKDTTPTHIKAVYDNLKKDDVKDGFTLGIIDDVTYTSIIPSEQINTSPKGTVRCKFWGLGSDGTVGANQNAIKIIGDNTDLYAQAYFSYDSKKSGGVTVSHLRFGKEPIKSTYLIDEADFIACHNEAYVHQFDLVKGLAKNGTFLLNCTWTPEELEKNLPATIKKYLAENNIDFYTIDAVRIAESVGLGGRINMIMQTAFFKLANIIPVDEAISYLKEAIQNTYGSKGEHIVKMNWDGVDQSLAALNKVDVPSHWANAVDTEVAEETDTRPAFIKNILEPIVKQKGDELPVSTFLGMEDGTMPAGTAAYEKRGIAVQIPQWEIDNCIQCNQCSFVCPHGVIRPFVLNEEEMAEAPADFETKPAIGRAAKGLGYRIQVSPLDCTGCGVCADVCPSKKKALVMKPLNTQIEKQKPLWEFAIDKISPKKDLMDKFTLKGSQFQEPLFEFSGACAGCGETPYAKLLTQLFGDRMIIANATGCSSIWGGSYPSSPYTVNKEGCGPAWANSLFEDNAEYGYGMLLGVKQNRDKLTDLVNEAISKNIDEALTAALNNWLENKEDGEESQTATKELLPLLESHSEDATITAILDLKQYLIKKSQWIFGGDGWAYDIGFGGLDHVLASGDNVNVFVFDTEVYSNTGGQASKATPTAAVAKFAAAGKRIRKKDLGRIAMTYGYVYVAQIAMGADMNHTVRVLKEAEAYPGPSLIIAYSPCIAHGMRGGLVNSSNRTKLAVQSGYWHLYRYNPLLKAEEKNPFTLDSKEPTEPFQDFLKGEVRYTSLAKTFPEVADEFFQVAENDAKERYNIYKAMSESPIV